MIHQLSCLILDAKLAIKSPRLALKMRRAKRDAKCAISNRSAAQDRYVLACIDFYWGR